VAITLGIRVEVESFDLADLSLPWGQDAVIEAVAEANPNTIAEDLLIERQAPTTEQGFGR
jgi:hypothetical protein